MKVVYYEGERIYFRPIELSDEPRLRSWINDPRVWSTLHHRPPINELGERKWIESLAEHKQYVFAIVARDGDRHVGTCGLHDVHPVDHRATFGLMIGDVEAQGQGYGGEATRLAVRYGFKVLNLHRIGLCVFEHNARAIRAYEKAGFALEGRGREMCYLEGRYWDVLHYGILRDDWRKAQAATTDAIKEPDARPDETS